MAVIKPHEIWYLHVPHFASKKGSDEPVHLRNLDRAVAVCTQTVLTSMKAQDSKLGGYFKFVILNL